MKSRELARISASWMPLRKFAQPEFRSVSISSFTGVTSIAWQQMIALAESLEAERVELANVQFYGWAFLNRAALLPTREQVVRAREIATAAKARLAGKIDIFYVLPDYYETRPKPCLNGWGQRYLTVNPIGDVLPCPTASSAIPDLRFENVRARCARLDLAGIGKLQPVPWNGMDAGAVSELSAKRNRFWWLPLSGCVADRKRSEHRPGCDLSSNRAGVDAVLRDLNSSSHYQDDWTYRVNPKAVPCLTCYL